MFIFCNFVCGPYAACVCGPNAACACGPNAACGFFHFSDSHETGIGDKVENDKGKNCGKIRNFIGKDGLALLRVAECIGKRSLNVLDESGHCKAEGKTHIPPWWPVETDEIMRKVTGMK